MIHLFGRPLDVAKTVVHFLMFVVLGLMTSIPGPTLIDLKTSSGTDAYGISFIFTARSIGYLIGSLIGGIVLDCIRNEGKALIVSSFFVACGAYLIPWCRGLPMLLCTFFIAGFAMGFCNTGSNASVLRIWGKKGAPFFQALHFSFGLGGFIAPVLAAPFLSVSAPTPTNNEGWLMNETQLLMEEILSSSASLPFNTTEDVLLVNSIDNSIPSITYAYTIIGIISTLVASCFIFVSVLESNAKATDGSNSEINIRDPGLPFTIVVVIFACLQTGLTSGIEVSFTQMLTSYVVQSKHGLSKVVGSYITSAYWGSYTLTRGLSIILACKINVLQILVFDFILSLSASLVLVSVGTWSVTALWIGSALFGVGVASIFPATLSLVEKYININNRIASVFTLVSCILEMTVPLSISIYLPVEPNILFYFMTGALIGVCCLFIVMNIILNWKGEKYVTDVDNVITEEKEAFNKATSV